MLFKSMVYPSSAQLSFKESGIYNAVGRTIDKLYSLLALVHCYLFEPLVQAESNIR